MMEWNLSSGGVLRIFGNRGMGIRVRSDLIAGEDWKY
jgi:hypothetical protein